jgi:hypothetical protein
LFDPKRASFTVGLRTQLRSKRRLSWLSRVMPKGARSSLDNALFLDAEPAEETRERN